MASRALDARKRLEPPAPMVGPYCIVAGYAGNGGMLGRWVHFATVCMTNPTTAKLVDSAICFSDGTDIACDNTGQYTSTGGLTNAVR